MGAVLKICRERMDRAHRRKQRILKGNEGQRRVQGAKQDPEQLLRQANQKFTKRFHGVEQQVKDSKINFEQHSLAALEAYWQQVKLKEKIK